jgi:predicted alpha/beta hydrolase family esterase
LIERFAEQVVRVLDELYDRPVCVGGHSIGGMVAIQVAGSAPERVAGVISLEGWTSHRAARAAPTRAVLGIPARRNIDLQVIAGVSHYLHIERPDEVAIVCRRFLAGIRSSDRRNQRADRIPRSHRDGES